MFQRISFVVSLMMVALLAGCTPPMGTEAKTAPISTDPSVEGTKYLLDREPADAKSVLEVRKNAKDGDEVVIAGRIGGNAKPWVEGRAAFLIADPSLKSCSETGDDGCKTPWDYCCTPDEELTAGLASVKFVDDKGQTVATDARTLLGVKELDYVIVKGKLKKEGSSFVILATGLHRRK